MANLVFLGFLLLFTPIATGEDEDAKVKNENFKNKIKNSAGLRTVRIPSALCTGVDPLFHLLPARKQNQPDLVHEHCEKGFKFFGRSLIYDGKR